MIVTAALVAAMAGVLGITAWVLGGWTAVAWAAGGLLCAAVVVPRLSPAFVMRVMGARPVPPWQLLEVRQILAGLAREARLAHPPKLYAVPDPRPNAFTVGVEAGGAIAVSEGLVRVLPPRELQAVLAHEMSHLLAGDAELMRICGLLAEATRLIGIYGLILCLGLVLTETATVPVPIVLLFGLAPTAVVLLQLALARHREFAADNTAASLTGDPRALASALNRIDSLRSNPWWGLPYRLMVPRRDPAPWLSTHPSTAERVRRLLGAYSGHGMSPSG